MFLIDQRSNHEANIMAEAIGNDNGKSWYLDGIAMQAETYNGNGRKYQYSEIKAVVDKTNQQIKNGFPILGEADHPDKLTINIDRVSHVIESMKMVGNDAHAKMKVLDTPMGRIVSSLLKERIPLGLSSRGSGDLDSQQIVHNFEFVTVDIVVTPSAPNAYPRSIYESLMNMHGGEQILNMIRNDENSANLHIELASRIRRFISEINKF